MKLGRTTGIDLKRGIAALMLFSSLVNAQRSELETEVRQYVTGLPFAMEAPKLPEIPDRSMSIVDFGAVADGRTMNSNAFADAIEACAKAGGGRVVIPQGVWLTGPIRLQSNIDLHTERGALVIFSPKFEDYPLVRRDSRRFRCVAPISGSGLENIAITGEGVFNGSGEAWRPLKKNKTTESQWKQFVRSGGVVDAAGEMWWPSKEAMNGEKYLADLLKTNNNPTAEQFAVAREFLRPDMVSLIDCRRVLLDGPTFENSPTFCIHPAECEDLVIRNITVRNEWWAQNGDAIDLSSCHNVLVVRSVITAGDDGICLKPGGFSKKRPWTAACENIVIADCTVYRAHGGFVIGSETYGGVRNIAVRNLTCIGTDIGLRFKSLRERGGLVEKVFIDGVQMRDIADQAILFDTYYSGNPELRADPEAARPSAEPVTPRTPRFDGITIANVVCDGADRAVLITGLPEMAVKHIKMSNLTISAKSGAHFSEAEGITMTRANIVPQLGPVISLAECRDITLDHVNGPGTGDVFLTVNGSTSDGIRLRAVDTKGYAKTWTVGSAVASGAVVAE